MGGNPRNRVFGLKLVWMSAAFQREHSRAFWYETATTRATARKKFEAETISGGKPKFVRIEELQR